MHQFNLLQDKNGTCSSFDMYSRELSVGNAVDVRRTDSECFDLCHTYVLGSGDDTCVLAENAAVMSKMSGSQACTVSLKRGPR